MNFWDFLVWLLWAYLLFAYLWILFSIFVDLFRDERLNGWGKALWILFLIFVPLLAALVYLIARGSGMARRGRERAAAAQQDVDAHIRAAAGVGASPSDEIAKAAGLRDSGAITPEEYERIKAKALG